MTLFSKLHTDSTSDRFVFHLLSFLTDTDLVLLQRLSREWRDTIRSSRVWADRPPFQLPLYLLAAKSSLFKLQFKSSRFHDDHDPKTDWTLLSKHPYCSLVRVPRLPINLQNNRVRLLRLHRSKAVQIDDSVSLYLVAWLLKNRFDESVTDITVFREIRLGYLPVSLLEQYHYGFQHVHSTTASLLHVTDKFVDRVAELMPSLRKLTFTGVQPLEAALDPLADQVTHVTLEVYRVDTVEKLSVLRGLTHLDLGHLPIDDNSGRLVHALSRFRHLQQLSCTARRIKLLNSSLSTRLTMHTLQLNVDADFFDALNWDDLSFPFPSVRSLSLVYKGFFYCDPIVVPCYALGRLFPQLRKLTARSADNYTIRLENLDILLKLQMIDVPKGDFELDPERLRSIVLKSPRYLKSRDGEQYNCA